jgi:hypothetical protein
MIKYQQLPSLPYADVIPKMYMFLAKKAQAAANNRMHVVQSCHTAGSVSTGDAHTTHACHASIHIASCTDPSMDG